MAVDNFGKCMQFVFEVEGGYTDDPLDPGGATNLGITFAELARWRHVDVTKDDVRVLKQDEAANIYRANYWNASRCDVFPAGVDLMIFDAAVNTGNGQSARFLQRIVAVAQDGVIGPQTINMARTWLPSDLVEELSLARASFYQSLPTFGHFGRGWLDRVDRCAKLARTMLT